MRRQATGARVGQRKNATHMLHRFVHDGQPQARTGGGRAGRIPPEEGFGQVGQDGRWHAGAVVADLDKNPFVPRFGADFNRRNSSVG